MTRLGARQLHTIADELSERDLATLDAIGRYRLMTVKHVTRLIFHDHASDETATRVCRRVLGRLLRLGLVKRLDRRIGGVRAGSKGHIYSLSPAGHRLLGKTGRKPSGEPGWQFVNHTLAVSDLGTAVTAAALDRGLEVLDVLPEPLCWRTYEGPHGRTTVKPDLFVRVADDLHELSWFVEVDLGTESLPTIQRKCQVYVDYWQAGAEQSRHGVFPKVLWVVPNRDRRSSLAASIVISQEHAFLFDVCMSGQSTGCLLDG